MNFNKFILCITLLMLPTISSAQIVLRPESQSNNSNSEVMKNFQIAARYNASLIGYANICSMNKSDIDKVENIFIKQINKAMLSQDNLNELNALYVGVKQQVINTPRQNINCNSFSIEFKKIMDFINS